MRNRKLVLGTLLVATIMTLMGCAEKNEGAASAKLQFSNANALAMDWKSQLKALFFPNAYAAAMSSPTAFKLKLISAYLSEDVDPVTQNNTGMNAMFYRNPECVSEDNMRCNVDAGTAEDGLPYTDIITTFFDFGQGSTAVNQALNAQNREIKPGIYRYVRLDFCKGGAGNPNAAWAGGNVAVETQFTTGMCGVTSAKMDPPLEVKEGDNITIWLGYDYSNSIQTGADAQGWDCVGAGATKTCFSIPAFIPAILQ